MTLNRRLYALLMIAIFIVGILAVMSPVEAHFTLGDLTGTYRYHGNDFDPHVQGQNLYLEQSNIPVPEFNGLIIAAVSALAASLYILRRRRNQ